MLRENYYEFVKSFGELNPYELDHLCEVLYRKFGEIIAKTNTDAKKEMVFNQQDLKHVFVKTMIDIQIFLAECRKEEAEQLLKQIKAAALAKEPNTKSDG
jgi:hypothetical protein